MASSGSSSTGSSVERAFRVLQVVVAATTPLGVREIGRRTGLPRSTVSRLVATLGQLHMVTRTPAGEVVAGSALATLQVAGGPGPSVGDRLRPLLTELVDRHREHAALAVDGGDTVLYLAQVLAEHPVSAPDVTGQRHPFHLVAPGLMAMAWWGRPELDRYLDRALAAPTDHSVVDPAVLRRRVEAARSAGHIWTEQELEVGVNGLAVPVVGPDGGLIASVSLYGPSYRFAPDHLPDLGPALRDTVADRAAVLLGHCG